MKQLPEGAYNFVETEKRILEFWQSKPFFQGEYNPDSGELEDEETFKQLIKDNREKLWVLVCPPPNAYDIPHMGNLSGYPYMDVMARYQRLFNKKRVIVLPGKDHAGIEGETTLIKKLEKEGKRKTDFTREEFYNLNYDLQQGFIKEILRYEKLIGLSADFSKDLYTLDPQAVTRVLNTFIEMYREGLVYKGVRIVNWDTKAQSALSDSQCERQIQKGKLYFIKYKLEKKNKKLGSDCLIVATSRPETLLGDTALVVNPSDERYQDIIGSFAFVPLVNRKVPIITSGKVEKEFGTGVLKLTPAHAPDDYQIMMEWNESQSEKENYKIGYINVINKYAKLTGPIPEEYKGLKVLEAREKIVKQLEADGLLDHFEDIEQSLVISERTGAIIEPLIASQWYIDVSSLKPKMIEAIQSGKLRIYPKSATSKLLNYTEKLRDWAISRNLWWGYRLPVWYAGKVEEIVDEQTGQVEQFINLNGTKIKLDTNNPNHVRVQIEKPEKKGENGEDINWIQDDEILDTWFSSGQWPGIILENCGLAEVVYPSDTLVSGYDLIIKWDLFMLLFAIYKYKTVPFKNLYLTGLVKGTDGQKMSKSKGNYIPLDSVQKEYGIDAFRMNCFYQNKAGAAYAINSQTLKNFRNFNNKIWNASKFVISVIKKYDKDAYIEKKLLQNIIKAQTVEELTKLIGNMEIVPLNDNFVVSNLCNSDSEMIDHLKELESSYRKKFDEFKFGLISSELYSSFWHFFCDIYLEKTKQELYSSSSEPLYKKDVMLDGSTRDEKELGGKKDNNGKKEANNNSIDENIKKEKSEKNLITLIILVYSLVAYLRMLHPFIPFITEEIFQHLIETNDVSIYSKPLMYS